MAKRSKSPAAAPKSHRRARSKSPAATARSVSPKRKASLAAAAAAAPAALEVLPGWGKGRDASGATFAVPPTPTAIQKLTDGSLLTYVTFLAGFVTIAVAFPVLSSKLQGEDSSSSAGSTSFVVAVAVFWRLAYNLGLGIILRAQSESSTITNLIRSARAAGPDSFSYRALSALTWTSTSGDVMGNADLPSEFVAWGLFRGIVNVVLPNDVLAFAMVVTCFGDLSVAMPDCGWESAICLPLPAAIGLGVALIFSSLLGKVRAHHVIGQYAWFWGDFFFAMDQELTFDGIFEIFPHPMYTVGYGWAYGCAILSRSYTVAALAMGSHLAQLLFLWLFETPHMDKIYGDGSSNSKRKDQSEEVPGLLLILNFDGFRAGDVLFVLVNFFSISILVLGSYPGGPLDSDYFFVANACGWRVATTAVLGFVLRRQERSKFWTRHFESIGLSAEEAFENWKRIWNTLSALQCVSFLACAARLFFRAPWAVEGEFAQHQALYTLVFCFSAMLCLISGWTWYCVWCDLGVYGHFYGDFFLPPPKKLAGSPKYSGIYRFLNNPTVYLGHCWEYALALLSMNTELLYVVLFCHTVHVIFLKLVETPHLRVVYSNNVREHSTAATKAIAQSSRRARLKAQQTVTDVKDTVFLSLISERAREAIQLEVAGTKRV